MRLGISTACFYPEQTDQALLRLQQADVPLVEIFLNTFSELGDAFVSRLQSQLAQYGTNVSQLHPFSSAMETFFFATDYGPRYEDGLALYRHYFSVCRRLGASRLALHGQAVHSAYPFELYCSHYSRLRREGRLYGIEVLQENVVRCKTGYPEQVRQMRAYTGDDVGFVLDTKQLRRAGVPLPEMLQAMGDKIRHIHISDAGTKGDCLPPGDGTEDFAPLVQHLAQIRFSGDCIIELYRDGFGDIHDLLRGLACLKALFA